MVPPAARTLTILHLNDVYDVTPRAGPEPVGGASRMAAKIKSYGPDALVLFSGDAFNPSLLSTVTQGKQMVEVLNCMGVKVAAAGNHDFDYGLDNFQTRAAECHFPWLMANVLDAESGKPLGGCLPTALLDWRGIRVGLIGLVEEEWLTTLASIDPDEVTYVDFVVKGRRLADALRQQGAELVVALTHMRLPNDLRLAESVPGIDLVLGGHDHDYFLLQGQGTGIPIVKSGTDFRDLTEIRVTLAPAGTAGTSAEAAAAAGSAATGGGAGDSPAAAAGSSTPAAAAAGSSTPVAGAAGSSTPEAGAAGSSTPVAGAAGSSTPVAAAAGSIIPAAAAAGSSTPLAAATVGSSTPAAAAAGSSLAAPTSPLSPGSRPAEVPPLTGTALRCPHDPHPDALGCSKEGQAAADVYVGAADASLAVAMHSTRAAGGNPGSGLEVRVHCLRHAITSDLPQDPETEEIVERYSKLMGERMDVVVGVTHTDLDGRFATVRTGESNLGNFVCDVWREACRCDVALLNGGTLRSDRIHLAGELTHRDLCAVLPMLDDTVVIEITGAQLLAALENGVSEFPKLEGRFPQVSGIRFSFDPSRPPDQRVVPGSITVGDSPLQPDGKYSLATKKYLAEGRDGYEALTGAPLLRDSDCTPLLPTVVMNHFLLLRTVNRYVEATGRLPAWRRAAERLLSHSASYASKSAQRLQSECVSRTVRKHPLTGRWEIAPVVDGRIRRVGADECCG